MFVRGQTITALIPPWAVFSVPLNHKMGVLLYKSGTYDLLARDNWARIFRYSRTSSLSCILSASYPSSSSSSSGILTTTEPPQPPTQVTRATSVQIQPRLDHSTSLTAEGFGDHRSTRRNVSNRSRKRSRSHGLKLGRDWDEDEEAREEERASFRASFRTEAGSRRALLVDGAWSRAVVAP